MNGKVNNTPTILIVFGATGDLMTKKIAPAIFHLQEKQRLPDRFRVVGFSRQNLSDDIFRDRLIQIISRHLKTPPDKEQITSPRLKISGTSFLKLFFYKQGLFDKAGDYRSLSETLTKIDAEWNVCANKFFYLAVPPQLYETIFENLAASGLTIPCSVEEGWTRVIVEKPFGKDSKTAQRLDELLCRLFKEMQIYRIDHYLAKEMLQNILAFRFSNNLFENNWGNRLIEKIEIRLLEKIGVEDRGSFYDGVGALRDVGQNHLLQMLALLTMDYPASFEADAIRARRAEALQTLKIPAISETAAVTFRAQYEGYKDIRGVVPDSKTETYFKALAYLTAPRWHGVPVVLEGGKRLGESRKEVIITFKHPMPCLCPPGNDEHYQNKVIIRLEPAEEIAIKFWSKKPGHTMDMEERMFQFHYREKTQHMQYTEEYEKLLLDCITGNQTLFVSTDEIKAMWRFIDPIIDAWGKDSVPLKTYRPDTRTILEDSKIIEKTTPHFAQIKKEIGIIGLGRMGGNIALHLLEREWRVAGFNRTSSITEKMEKEGLVSAYNFKELIDKISMPRIILLMLPSGKIVDETLDGLVNLLEKGDIVIDGGNSFYKDSVRRAEALSRCGIEFFDVGVSGGPGGVRTGASLMIGGKRDVFQRLEALFKDMAVDKGYQFFDGIGAGHFVKMVHNGIEYGMMQAIAEGFTILKNSRCRLDLTKVADVYNHGSVIESRLIGWLKQAFEIHGEDLKDVSGVAAHTGEGAWTIETAKEMKLKAKVIEEALNFRIESKNNPDYTGRIISALREQFGRHPVK